MIVTFLEAASKERLAKTFTPEKTIPYPLVKNLNSYEIEVNSIKEFEKALRTGADKGWMMLRGGLTKILKNESRRGYNDRSQKIHTVTFDIDGISPLVPMHGKQNASKVRKVAESIVGQISDLCDVSYVAKASSSFGRRSDKISIHLEFIIEEPVRSNELKLWLKHLNLTNPMLSENLSLSNNKSVLSFPLDLGVADSGHHVNCGPPIFKGVPDPFDGNDADRIVRVDKGTDFLKIDTSIDITATKILENKILQRLRRAEGLGTKITRVSNVQSKEGFSFEVIKNPEEMTIEIYDDHGEFVHADINGGDSHSYYWPKNNPTFVYNFKGEPVFRMKDASPIFYAEYKKKYGDVIVQSHGLQKGDRPIVFREPMKDVFYSMIYNKDIDEIRQFAPIKKQHAPNFLLNWGADVPDVYPEYSLRFLPETNVQFNSDERWVNQFRPTKFLKAEGLPDGIEPTVYGTMRDAVRKAAPAVYVELLHVLGDQPLEVEHFLNWVAFIIQTRNKTGTAWVLSGTSGTGKGLLFQKILQPIFGIYAKVAQSRTIDDTFNIFLWDCLILFVDEFRMDGGVAGAKTNDILKNTITDHTLVYREMRQAPFSDQNHTNFIFASNDIDVMKISTDDRRINVGSRQEKSLKDTPFKTLPDDLNCEDTLYAFCQICMAHEIDHDKVKELIKNEARDQMQMAAMNSVDQFFHALSEGDLDWFVEYTVFPIASKDEMFRFLAAKNIIEGWVLTMKDTEYATVADVKAVYDTIMRTKDADPLFTQKLLKRGFTPSRIRNKITKKRQNSIKVNWKLISYEVDEIIGEIKRSTGQESTNNVVRMAHG